MVNFGLALELISVEQLGKLTAVAMHHGEVKWSKVLVKGRIGEVLTKVTHSKLTLSMLKKKAFSIF